MAKRILLIDFLKTLRSKGVNLSGCVLRRDRAGSNPHRFHDVSGDHIHLGIHGDDTLVSGFKVVRVGWGRMPGGKIGALRKNSSITVFFED